MEKNEYTLEELRERCRRRQEKKEKESNSNLNEENNSIKESSAITTVKKENDLRRTRNEETAEEEKIRLQIDSEVKRILEKKKEEKKEDLSKQQKKEGLSKKQKKEEKRKQKRIAKISSQIERNLAHQTRYTEPKKRNLLGRIILQNRLAKGYYEDIEEEYDLISQEEIDESKNATKRRDRSFYKEVQAYEDAREDVTARKGWTAFKIGLAAALLAGCLAVTAHMGKEMKETFNYTPPNVSIETLSEEKTSYYEDKVEEFKNQVKEFDGYEFVHLTDEELLDGYLRIIDKESKMLETQFRGAMFNLKDQTTLDDIVINSFGEEKYETFTEEQKRDYRQLAFELLPISLPEIFNEDSVWYVRNPIVMDELQAEKSAKEKGYTIKLIVNSDREETVKAIGRLIYISNTLEEADYQAASTVNDGQDLLDEMVKEALDVEYENVSDKDLRDYKQIAYELLPDNVKQKYIKDPIALEKSEADMEIGD